jgi:anti-anti-sigma regulatory factor
MTTLSLTVDHESTAHAIRVCTGGPVIDRTRARAAVETVEDLVAGHTGRLRTLIIDVEDLQIPNSMAVSMLLELARIAQSHRLEAVLHRPNEALLQLLRMLRLDGRFAFSLSNRELSRAMAA